MLRQSLGHIVFTALQRVQWEIGRAIMLIIYMSRVEAAICMEKILEMVLRCCSCIWMLCINGKVRRRHGMI